MSQDSPNPHDVAAAGKKRPIISLPFLIIVPVLGVGAYLSGPWVMEQVFLQQEKSKANVEPQAPEQFAEVSQLAKTLDANENMDAASAFGALGTAPPEGNAPAGEGERPRERSLAGAEGESPAAGSAQAEPSSRPERSIAGIEERQLVADEGSNAQPTARPERSLSGAEERQLISDEGNVAETPAEKSPDSKPENSQPERSLSGADDTP